MVRKIFFLCSLVLLAVSPVKAQDDVKAAGAAIHQVLALTRAVDAARDGHLVVVDGELVVAVVQRDRNISKTQGFPEFRSGEDDVLHGRPAELLDALLPEHPPDGVRDVAFAGSVRSHDGGDAVVELEYHFVGKGLEALDLNTL